MSQQTSHRPFDVPDPSGTLERVRLSFRLLRDPRVPTWVKAAGPVVAAIYVIMPIDLIPDFILGLGQIDDVSVLGIALFAMTKLLPRLAPQDVVEEHLSDLRGRRRRSPQDRGTVIDAAFTVAGEAGPRARQQHRNEHVWGNRA